AARPIDHRIEVKQKSLIERTVQIRCDGSLPGRGLTQRIPRLAELPLTRVPRSVVADGLVAKKLAANLMSALLGGQERFQAFTETLLAESDHQVIPRSLHAIGTHRKDSALRITGKYILHRPIFVVFGARSAPEGHEFETRRVRCQARPTNCFQTACRQ